MAATYSTTSGTAIVSSLGFGFNELDFVAVSGTTDINANQFSLSGTTSIIVASDSILGEINFVAETRDTVLVSGSGSFTALNLHEDLSGTITVVMPYEEVSGSLTVIGPSDISGTLSVSSPSDLSGTVTVFQTGSSDVSGTISVEKPSNDLSGTISVTTGTRDSSDLSGTITVIGKKTSDLNSSINVSVDTFLDGTIEVEKNTSSLSGTVSVKPYSSLSGTIQVEEPSLSIDGRIIVGIFAHSDISGTIEVDRWTKEVSGSILVNAYSFESLNATITVDKFQASKDINGAIIVTWATQFRDLPSVVVVEPYQNLSGSITVERPSELLSGTIQVKPRFDGNLTIDKVFAQDSISISKAYLEPISGSVSESVLINPADNIELDLLPHIRATGTDVLSLNANDSIDSFFYSEGSAEWSYPIQLTDNIVNGNDFSLPTVTEFDGEVHVAYNHNFNNELTRTIVVKTQEGGKYRYSKWIVSNIYDGTINSQFVGPNAHMIQEHAYGFVSHPGPQAEEANSYFESEIIFSPESYDIEASMYQHLWSTIEYKMQREGHIYYPPENWKNNPISEAINGPIDNFDPIPKSGDYAEPTGSGGYYQDFNNFFTGNG